VRLRRSAAALSAALLLTACQGGVAPPGESNVEVDTPELREQKAAAGIEPCEPGTGSGGELPDLTLPCLGGGADVDLSTLEGPMLLNVWFSGCAPCVREMPVLQQLHEEDGGRIAVVGIDVETSPGAAIRFADEVGATYPQLADPGGTVFDDAELRLPAAFPVTVLLDADGRVAYKAAVELTSLGQVHDLVRDHLGLTL
jgi:thiol-disulfide isomerase/thioredoxin